jgi:hypothetical protein
MKKLATFRQFLEALVENRDELKAKNCPDARQDHARFVRRMSALFFK